MKRLIAVVLMTAILTGVMGTVNAHPWITGPHQVVVDQPEQ